MIITIKNLKCPSWNEFNRAVYWAVRAAKRDELKQLVFMCIFSQYNRSQFKRMVMQMNHPVDIKIVAHFKNSNRRDPDNLFVKPLLDGIVKAGLLPDDSGKYINSLTLSTKIKASSDKIMIYINE